MNSIDAGAGATIAGLLLMLIIAAFSFFGLIFWIWMLIHAIRNKGLSDTERLIWVLVIIFVNLLGAIIYFFVGRPRAKGA